MKWFQLDSDFNTRAAIRQLRAQHGSAGVDVILNIWSKIAARIEPTNAMCRLEEGLDLVGHDCGVPTDKVAAVVNTAYGLVYEVIHEIPFYLMDYSETVRQPGCILLLYKLDNTTSASQYIKSLKIQRDKFTSKNLRRHFEDASKELRLHTYIPTDIQTYLQGLAPESAPAVGQHLDHVLLQQHFQNKHPKDDVEGCPVCKVQREIK
jgi:hypothetical protein